jgi:hypothetical protein
MEKKAVGMFRTLSFENLNFTAGLFRKHDATDVYYILDEALTKTIHGKEGRRKLINNLMSVWGNGRQARSPYQVIANDIYPLLHRDEQIVMNYLMIIAAFPFFGDTACLIGKYQRLVDMISSKTITNEIFALYGTSGTVVRSISNNIGTLTNLDLLVRVKPGTYAFPSTRIVITSPEVKEFMAFIALVASKSDATTLNMLNNNPLFWGLQYHFQATDFSHSKFRLQVERSETYIELKDQGTWLN